MIKVFVLLAYHKYQVGNDLLTFHIFSCRVCKLIMYWPHPSDMRLEISKQARTSVGGLTALAEHCT